MLTEQYVEPERSIELNRALRSESPKHLTRLQLDIQESGALLTICIQYITGTKTQQQNPPKIIRVSQQHRSNLCPGVKQDFGGVRTNNAAIIMKCGKKDSSPTEGATRRYI